MMTPQTLQLCAPDLQDQLKRWQDWMAFEKNLSRHSIRAYCGDVTRFITFLAHHHGKPPALNDLSATSVSDFRAWLSRQTVDGKANTSRARALSSIKNFLKWLDRRGVMHNAAINTLRSPKRAHTLPRPLEESQARRAIENADLLHQKDWLVARDNALFTMLYACGLRINEALSLNCANMPRDGFLRVLGKGNKERQVPVLPIAEDALQDYNALCPYPFLAERPLFIGAKGQRLNQGVAQKAMRDLRKLINLPETATPHALRHSFATHLLQNGANLREIQEMLGHASLSTTQRYTELNAKELLAIHKAAHPRG